MINRDPVTEMTKRTQRYWYEDGIWEIGFGLINALLGGFYLLTGGYDWQGPLAIVLMLMQMAVIVGGFWGIGRLVKFLKERITYPRTGFVEYRKPGVKSRVQRVITAALLSITLSVLIAALASMQATQNQIVLIISIVMAGMLVYLGRRFELARLYVLAVPTILLGYLISRFSMPETTGNIVFFGGFGLLMMASGLVTLLLYLNRTRIEAVDENNGLNHEI